MVLRSAALAALLLLGVALAVLLPADAPADHNGPLAGQWHLEGSADDSEADSSGHGLTGIEGSTGGGVEATAGRFGNGLLFDHFSSIRVAPSTLLEPANVTLVAWVKSDGTPGVTNTIVAKGGDPACTASSYALDTGAGGLEFYVRGPAGNARFSSPAAAASTVWDNQWHGVAGVYDGTMVRLYVDGQQVGSGTPGPPNIDYNRANREFTMGEYPSCDNFGYGERLDEVQVYNRALSGSEIATLHDASATSPPVIGPSGGGEPPPPPPPSTPPTADFAFKQRSPTVARTIRLNGAGSSAATGRTIASYAWDLNRDGRFEFVARGDTPAISTTIRRPGRVTATLLVIDSAGETDTVTESFTVGRANTNRTSFTTFERPADGPNESDRPGCVKTVAFAIVEVNGRGGPNQCFKIEWADANNRNVQLPDFGTARAAQIGRRTFVVHRAEIDGPVAINGLPVPLPSGFTTRYEAWLGRVELGRVGLQLPLPGGARARLAEANLNFDVPSRGSVRLPPLTTGSAGRFAGLRLGGSVDVTLRKRPAPPPGAVGAQGSPLGADIDLGLTLPNFLSDSTGSAIQGTMRLAANNVGGLSVASAAIRVPDAYIGPMRLEDFSLAYEGPPAETLQAAVNFIFPSISILGSPPPVRGIGFRNGTFDYAGLEVNFPPGAGPPLFPGVNLRRVEGRFQPDPLVITGGLGVSVASVIGIDGTMMIALASPQKPFTLPPGTAPAGLAEIEGRRLTSFAFAIGAQASLFTPAGQLPLNDAFVFYHHPGFLELGGGWRFRLGGDSAPYVQLAGGVRGWANLDPRRFNLEGNNEICFGIPTPFPFEDVELCQGVLGLISSRGAFACVKNIAIPYPPFFVPEVGLGFIWGGGPIPDISLFSCHPSDYREVRPSASASRAGGRAAQVRAFTLPRGLPSAQIRVRGEGGAPAVDVQGPGGTRISVPLDGEQAENTTGNNFMAMRMDANTVEIGLRKPARGRWTVTPRQGSAPIGRVAVSQGSASPRISGRVSGRGARRLLRYRIRNGEGQSVRFVEQGPRTHNQLGVARAGAGSIRFTPAPGGAGRRRILAYVEHDGVTVERIDVTRYAAPADAKTGKPRRLRVRRRKDAVLLRWRRVRGADGYAVVMQLSNRKRIFRVVKRPRLTMRGFHRLARGRVSVRSLTTGGPSSRPATARIKAVRAKRGRR